MSSAKDSISTITSEVTSAGLPVPNLRPYECNTADESAVNATFSQIVKDFGKVDVMCTNAGITGGEAAETYDFGNWKKMMDVNVMGSFLFAREAGAHMIERGIKGSIVMVSSMSGMIVNRPQKQSAYNAVSLACMAPSLSSSRHDVRLTSMFSQKRQWFK